MTTFVIKLIAMIFMFLSHMGTLLYGRVPYEVYYASYLIGRISFPIFAYFVVEGWHFTKSKWKYLLRLFIFACIAALPYFLAFKRLFPEFELNVIFTLFLGACCLLIQDFTWDRVEKKFRFLVILSLVPVIPAIFIHMDFDWHGVLAICVLGFAARLTDKKWIKILVLAAGMAVTYMVPMRNNGWIAFLCTIPAYVLLLLYNGRHGPRFRYLFYIFYPSHLLLIYLIELMISHAH